MRSEGCRDARTMPPCCVLTRAHSVTASERHERRRALRGRGRDVRRTAGRRGGCLRSPPGRAHGDPRPEWRRQDDAHARAPRPPRAGSGPGRLFRERPRDSAPAHRLPLAALDAHRRRSAVGIRPRRADPRARFRLSRARRRSGRGARGADARGAPRRQAGSARRAPVGGTAPEGSPRACARGRAASPRPRRARHGSRRGRPRDAPAARGRGDRRGPDGRLRHARQRRDGRSRRGLSRRRPCERRLRRGRTGGGDVIEFLGYPFFQRALLVGALTGLLCGALSFFVVLRRLAFVGSGVAHAAFGGVALATLAGLPPGLGGLVASLAVAVATARASESADVTEDTAVGVFTVAAMAAGVVALGFVKTNVDLFGLMFGNILTVDSRDLVTLAAATAGVLVALAFFFRPLLLASVDEEGARAAGVATGGMRLLVLALIAVAVVVALQVVGILLVSALLVLPAATARLLASRWPGFLTGSIVVALISVLGGLLLSVALDLAPGRTSSAET